MFGREVYFGGIRVGTNFALTPGYVSQPIPVMSGLSAAPSTVEIYVNDVLRQVSSIPPGPFALDNLPAMVGNGEARMVVRDILGRETVIVQSFFSASQLLAAGLDDWTVEAGAVRRDLGLVSDHYGPGFASGTWRRGISNTLTLEGRLEGARDNQLVGASIVSALPAQFLGKAAIAASHTDALGSGSLWLVGVERTGMQATASLQAQGASRNFRQLGEANDFTATKLQLAGNASYTSERAGTFGVGFASIRRYDSDKVATLTANYATRIGERSSLTLNISRAVDGVSGTAFGITFVMPLEKNRIVTAVANSHGKTQDYYATAAQNSDGDSGLGWRVLAGSVAERAHAEAGAYYLGRYAALSGDASVSSIQKTARFSASGGVVVADGHFFATRRVDQSFAIVEVPGHAGVGVGIGSNVLTRTDSAGIALIPHLLPYQSNALRIDPSDLPVSAEIDNIERGAVPAWRSAVKVKFPVRTGRGALLRIVLDDGDVAPAGAVVSIDGDNQEFFVARRGEAFVTGLQPANSLRLKWQEKECRFEVALPPANADEIARVGPLACHGVSR
jgi:outer membrane usher protein